MLLLTSCSTHRHCYEPVCPAAEWTASQESLQDPFPEEWWSLFESPVLTCLIEKAYRDNYTLKSAYERVIQALYLRQQISSRYFPQIDGSVDYTKSLSQFALGSSFFGSGTGTAGNTLNFANGAKQEVFLGGVDAIWEMDLFGHTFYEVQAACAFQGTLIEAMHAIKVTLASEIARYYFTICWERLRTDLLQEEINNLEHKLVLNESLRERGVESDFPVLETIRQLETLKEELSTSRVEFADALYKLIALMGDLPAETMDSLFESSEFFRDIPETIVIGIPSDLLRRRPDIREAEMSIKQAAAEIDVAVADFFPTLALTGSAKRERTTFQTLAATGPAWAYGAHLLAPIFHGGSLTAAWLEKKSSWRQSVYDYYNTVVEAIAEAESAIAAYEERCVIEKAAYQSYQAEKASYLRQNALKEAGIIDEMALIDSQNAEILSRLGWQQSRYNQLLSIISVYKALGGGW